MTLRMAGYFGSPPNASGGAALLDLPHKLLPLRDFPAECCASYGPNHDFLLSGRPTPRTSERTLAARPRSRARSILGTGSHFGEDKPPSFKPVGLAIPSWRPRRSASSDRWLAGRCGKAVSGPHRGPPLSRWRERFDSARERHGLLYHSDFLSSFCGFPQTLRCGLGNSVRLMVV